MLKILKRGILRARKAFTYFPFENILLMFLRGSDYRSASTKLIPPPDLYPPGSVKHAVRDGIAYELDRSCLMQWYIYWGLADVTRTRLYDLVKVGDQILDVGTNVGETLLNFGKLVGSEGHVYGFEPDERNFNHVQRNIALNSFANVEVFNLGVSDQKATVKLYRVDPNNLGMNRILSESEAEQFQDFTTIETDTIDHVIEENDIAKIDLVKIDIEGYEMHALRGARRTLEAFRPTLFIEVGYSRLLKNGTSPTEMMSFLESFGYKVFHADTGEMIDSTYDFSPLGDGGIDVYAIAEKR